MNICILDISISVANIQPTACTQLDEERRDFPQFYMRWSWVRLFKTKIDFFLLGLENIRVPLALSLRSFIFSSALPLLLAGRVSFLRSSDKI